jgi:hypothetical protein
LRSSIQARGRIILFQKKRLSEEKIKILSFESDDWKDDVLCCGMPMLS